MNNATITFRLNEEEKNALTQIAARYDMSVSRLIRQLIKKAIETKEANINE